MDCGSSIQALFVRQVWNDVNLGLVDRTNSLAKFFNIVLCVLCASTVHSVSTII